MATFQYKALDRKTNKEVKQTVEASNQAEAIASIKKQGLLPIEVKEFRGKAGKSAATGAAKAGGSAKKGGSHSVSAPV